MEISILSTGFFYWFFLLLFISSFLFLYYIMLAKFVIERNCLPNFLAKCDLWLFAMINSDKVSRYILYRLLHIGYQIGSFGKRIVTPLLCKQCLISVIKPLPFLLQHLATNDDIQQWIKVREFLLTNLKNFLMCNVQ